MEFKRFWNEKRCVVVLIMLVVIGICLTRAVGLTYNMSIHPDEHVFYKAAGSLADCITGETSEFTEVKEYPEGAYIFQMPFQLLRKGIEAVTGCEQDIVIWGRISSVFYFVAAVVLGMLILRRFFVNSTLSMIVYGLTMVFSLFFVEHSRYGVGDMISLFLLMVIIYSTGMAMSTGRRMLMIAACAAAGAMGAVKYPQLLFVLIPVCSFAYGSDYRGIRKAAYIVLLVSISVLTLLFFSPKAMFDLDYFARVMEKEGKAYITKGTAFEAGGLLNHIAEASLYSLLYSDFPGALIIMALGFAYLFRNGSVLLKNAEYKNVSVYIYLFYYVIPLVIIFFFIYNLFASLLIFRTYTPYYGISALYVSYFVAYIMRKKGKCRIIAVALTAVMVVRGIALISVTSSQEQISNAFADSIYSATDEGWSRTIRITPYNIPHDYESHVKLESMRLEDYYQTTNGDMEIKQGTLLMTGAYAYALGGDYIFPGNTNDAERMMLWNEFTRVNAPYYVGQSYHDYWYYVFGGWIRGGTLSTSLMPCNYIYYHPMNNQ